MPLVHATQDTLIHLNSQSREIKLIWVPFHTNIIGNDVDAAAKMALSQDSITPLPLPLSTVKRLISRTCQSTWNNILSNTLLNTNMGQYRTDSSPQPWVRQQSRVLEVALTCLRFGHTTLTAHLHRQGLAPDPYCPWCRNTEETVDHFIYVCVFL